MKKNAPATINLPIDSLPMSVAVYRYEDNNFTIVAFNKMAEKAENVKEEDLLGKSITEAFPAVKEFGLFDVLLRVHQTGKSEEFDVNFYQDDRIEGWRHNNVIKLENGDVAALYSDLTKQKQIENESSKQKEQLESLGRIIDNSINEVYIFNLNNCKFSYVNEAVISNLGYTLEEMQQMTPVDIKPEYTQHSFSSLLDKLIGGSKDYIIFNTVHQRKNGSLYDVEIRLQLMELNDRKQCVVIAHDISSRVALEHKLKRMATTDSLTGIYNRHMINEEIDIEIQRAKRYKGTFGLLMFDIDHFKKINDTYGHDIGDAVLIELCALVSGHIRDSDRFGRWGGEEFLILLPNLSTAQLADFAEKIRSSIETYQFEHISNVTVSIGATNFHPDDTKKLLLKRVDEALYQAKKKGRNLAILN